MMKSNNHTTFLTRCWRIIKLICWLMRTLWRVYSFKKMNSEERCQKLITISEDFLQTIHAKIQQNNDLPPTTNMPWLTVANHISLIDIFVLSKFIPGGFIAAQNLRKWPVLGKMITNVGTVYIDRSTRKDIAPVIKAIHLALQQQKNVLFFPEACTSPGLDILPFKAALFQAAIDANVPVQPVAIRYYDTNKQRTDKVSFAGKITLLQSLWKITSISEINIDIDFEPQLNVGDRKITDRYELKSQAEQLIKAKVLSDSPLQHNNTNN